MATLGPSLGRQVRSELLKLFTTRLWWGMGLGILAAGAAFATLFAVLYGTDQLGQVTGGGAAPVGDPTQIVNTVYTAGIGVGYLLLLTIGVIQIGSEYRHLTITGTFLATPRRVRVMLAKVVALLVIGAGYALVSMVGSVAFGATTLALFGKDPFPSTEVVRTLLLSLLVLGLWALIGLGVGILIRNQVAALLIGVGVAWIVEPLLGYALSFWDFAAEHVVPYLPSEATNAVINTVQNGADTTRLSWWVGALVLAAYAAALSGLGIWRTVHEDIS
jgi:ABC-2 type transport system permease protein